MKNTLYIGLAFKLDTRIMEHLIWDNYSSSHLQYFLIKFGLAAFTFSVIEFYLKDQPLLRDQRIGF